jgi:hypothetical protein
MDNIYLDISFEAIRDTHILFLASNLCNNKLQVKSGSILLKPIKTNYEGKAGALYLKDSPKLDLIERFINQIHLV